MKRVFDAYADSAYCQEVLCIISSVLSKFDHHIILRFLDSCCMIALEVTYHAFQAKDI